MDRKRLWDDIHWCPAVGRVKGISGLLRQARKEFRARSFETAFWCVAYACSYLDVLNGWARPVFPVNLDQLFVEAIDSLGEDEERAQVAVSKLASVLWRVYGYVDRGVQGAKLDAKLCKLGLLPPSMVKKKAQIPATRLAA